VLSIKVLEIERKNSIILEILIVILGNPNKFVVLFPRIEENEK